MSKKRMFSLAIIESDIFLDMPLSSQALYFHLSMNADDFGFVSPKRIMRMVGANNDDLQVLIAKRYVLSFDSGVVVLKHWQLNNTVRKDRSTPTTYKQEFERLTYNEFGAYTERRTIKTPLLEKQQSEGLNEQMGENDNQMSTQTRLDKTRLDYKVTKVTYVELQKQVRLVYDFFIQQFSKNENQYRLTKNRQLKIKARLKDAGEDMLKQAISNTAASQFHRGDNDRGWQADLDFIIRSYEQVEKLVNMAEGSNDDKFKKELERYVR